MHLMKKSIDFVKEIYKFFEINFIIRFDASYFDHCIDFLISNTLP